MAEPGAAGAKAIFATIGAIMGSWLGGKVRAAKVGGAIGGVVGAWVGERIGPVVMTEGAKIVRRGRVAVQGKLPPPSP